MCSKLYLKYRHFINLHILHILNCAILVFFCAKMCSKCVNKVINIGRHKKPQKTAKFCQYGSVRPTLKSPQKTTIR